MKRASFDFDDTLELEETQNFVRELQTKGVECWIVTTRSTSKFYEVHQIADNLGIKKHHIIFTNGRDKIDFFKGKDDWFDFHVDDDFFEINQINCFTNIPAITIFGENWHDDCRNLLFN